MSTRCGMCAHLRVKTEGTYECVKTGETMGIFRIEHAQKDWTCPDWVQRDTSILTGKPIATTECPYCGRKMSSRVAVCPFCDSKHKKLETEHEAAMPIPNALDLVEAIFEQARNDYIRGKVTVWKMDNGYIKQDPCVRGQAEHQVRDVTRFLHSDWAGALSCSNIDADSLLKVLDRDAEEFVEKYAEGRANGKQIKVV